MLVILRPPKKKRASKVRKDTGTCPSPHPPDNTLIRFNLCMLVNTQLAPFWSFLPGTLTIKQKR